MLLLSKLSHRIVIIYDQKFSFHFINLQLDPQTALTWCKNHASRWFTFGSNRVAQIQELTSNYQWRHIKSKNNPADIMKSGFWLSGPQFLSEFSTNLEVPKESNLCSCEYCLRKYNMDENILKIFRFLQIAAYHSIYFEIR